jgi:hypothetical protein
MAPPKIGPITSPRCQAELKNADAISPIYSSE